MPELPEVETTLRGIGPHILHSKVEKVIIRHLKLRWPNPQHLNRILKGQTLNNITRRAKYLLLTFDTGTLIIHLGMSGRLSVLPIGTHINKHDHVDILFSNETLLRYTDPRRFGAVLWVNAEPLQHPLLINIGVEPLGKEFNPDYLHAQLAKRKLPIKSCLLNSHIVAGIGNIYATEALFIAGIDPRKPAQDVTLAQLKKLVPAIKAILKQAIAKGGTTLKDFLQSDGSKGFFSLELKAYGRADKPCPNCNTILKNIRISARSTVYCTHCQT
jgi:formamidopyrimidine-DNA glycosylase